LSLSHTTVLSVSLSYHCPFCLSLIPLSFLSLSHTTVHSVSLSYHCPLCLSHTTVLSVSLSYHCPFCLSLSHTLTHTHTPQTQTHTHFAALRVNILPFEVTYSRGRWEPPWSQADGSWSALVT